MIAREALNQIYGSSCDTGVADVSGKLVGEDRVREMIVCREVDICSASRLIDKMGGKR